MSDLNIGQLPGQQFYCRVLINNHEISPSNIHSMTIREWVVDILPRIEIVFGDLGTFIETYPFEEGAEIQVTLSKQKDATNVLSMSFYLNDYSVSVRMDNKQLILSVSGYMKSDNMFQVHSRSFHKKTSEDVLKQVASEAGIKFSNPNSVIPSDKMTWYQMHQSNYDFIRHVLKRAFVTDDSVFFYASSDNTFTYTTLNKQINRKVDKVARYSVEQTEAKNNVDKDRTLYYNAYDIVNLAGHYNKETNYGLLIEYFDLKTEKSITYHQAQTLSELTFQNKKYAGSIVYNAHGSTYNNLNIYSEKYYESIIRNMYLVNNFFDFSIVIQADPDEGIGLFNKVNLVLPSILTGEPNHVMGGEYLVGGIIHNISNGGVYKKMISLHRNGMNKSTYDKQPVVRAHDRSIVIMTG